MYDIDDMQAHDYGAVEDPTGFDAGRLEAEGADRHLAVISGERLAARCSIWWRDTPLAEGRRAGVIGHYAAESDEAAAMLLDHACGELGRRGCRLALGPMDGNTWRRYRFVTRRGTARPFFLEPDNPKSWPGHFRASGFGTYASYLSELNTDFRKRQPAIGDLRARFRRLGVRIEPLDPRAAPEVLRGIHDVACEAFAQSLLFTPIGFDEFATLYAPFLTAVDPRLMLVARHAGRLVGFIFAPPDYLQDRRPAGIDTIVIKTVAIRPDARYRGLGRLLIVEMLAEAAAMGYRQAISALMHAENRSQKISRNCAGPMREYRLFARELAA